MRKILLIIVCFFAMKNIAMPSSLPGFLAEEAVEPTLNEEGVHEPIEEEGYELHYAYGTKGFWVCLSIALGFTCYAGIMSGLTVGLLSIDTLELEMKMIHGTDEQKKLAKNVLPMLDKHHYLLVTLLLNNAIAMEALPIFLDAIVPSAWAIAISVTLVLFFGEIIPQALCIGPQQLKIASFVAPYVNFLMIACGIITYPISRILDWLLGEHHAIRYTNNDLKALIELHSLAALQETLGHPGLNGFGLQAYQTKMIQGAIEIQQQKVKDIMIPFERVYSIRINKSINFKHAKRILKYGYSRIPVYMLKNKHSIIGYLLIKTLVGVDLSKERTISDLIKDDVVVLRRPLYVNPGEDIGPLLTRFKKGKSHMAIVTDNVKGMEYNMKKYMNDDGSFIVDSDDETPCERTKPKVSLPIVYA
jgi:metal transporter CNNM